MHARERLYFTGDRQSLVGEGNPNAAFLYAALGDEIPASAAEKFGLVDGKLTPKSAAKNETLLGSSVLPAMVEIGSGKTVQLGTIVAAAHKASGLSGDAWNALPEDEREGHLATMVEKMRAPKPAKAARGKAPAKEQKPAGDKEQKPGESKGG
jgi:hypothetical protein